ncbi:MAG: hypothetical protein WA761_04145 [Thermoplasmata archaeon]
MNGRSTGRTDPTGPTSILREPYHYFVLPILAYFAAYPSSLVELLRNGTWTASFDFKSPVFPITYVVAIGLFVLLILGLRGRVGWFVAAFYAVSIDCGAVGMYELVLDEFFPNTFYLFKLGMFSLVLFGLVSLRLWKIDGWTLVRGVAWFAVFFLWVFVAPSLPDSRADTLPFLFNALTKIGAFVVFASPLYLGAVHRRWSHHGPAPGDPGEPGRPDAPR